MKTSKALKEERAQKFQEFQGLQAKGDGMTAEEQLRFNALADEIEKLNDEVTAAEKREKIAIQVAGAGAPGANQHSSETEKDLKRFSMAKALSEKRFKGKLTGIEAEVEQQYAQEREARGVKEDGGIYIPSDFVRWGNIRAFYLIEI